MFSCSLYVGMTMETRAAGVISSGGTDEKRNMFLSAEFNKLFLLRSVTSDLNDQHPPSDRYVPLRSCGGDLYCATANRVLSIVSFGWIHRLQERSACLCVVFEVVGERKHLSTL